MNTPTLVTERLILRKFTEEDIEALFLILKDEEVNKFLPWYPMKDIGETKKFYNERYAAKYLQTQAYAYAICLKNDNVPIGYINVDMEEHHDFGYGLRKEFWHQGIVTEAGRAVVEQVKKDGIPYITATHDRNNPRSGSVMQKVGMRYCYSYEEQWQPKDFPVIFRMYQLNFDGNDDFVYEKYWNMYDNHFVENLQLDICRRMIGFRNMVFKVAILQMSSIAGEIEKNTKTIISRMEEAAKANADILLVPECFLTGYVLPISNEDALSDDDECIKEICKAAKELQ